MLFRALIFERVNLIMVFTKAHAIETIYDQIGFHKNHSSEILETI
jgi:hypothetical protein